MGLIKYFVYFRSAVHKIFLLTAPFENLILAAL